MCSTCLVKGVAPRGHAVWFAILARLRIRFLLFKAVSATCSTTSHGSALLAPPGEGVRLQPSEMISLDHSGAHTHMALLLRARSNCRISSVRSICGCLSHAQGNKSRVCVHQIRSDNTTRQDQPATLTRPGIATGQPRTVRSTRCRRVLSLCSCYSPCRPYAVPPRQLLQESLTLEKSFRVLARELCTVRSASS